MMRQRDDTGWFGCGCFGLFILIIAASMVIQSEQNKQAQMWVYEVPSTVLLAVEQCNVLTKDIRTTSVYNSDGIVTTWSINAGVNPSAFITCMSDKGIEFSLFNDPIEIGKMK